MIEHRKIIHCDSCETKVDLGTNDPFPAGWFDVGGRFKTYGLVCSRACLEKVAEEAGEKKKQEIKTGLMNEYDKINT